MLDFWTISRVNRWGFLDRPPPPPPPTNGANEPSCRVAVVGDSFVEGTQVPVSDKLHVRLEEMAHERLPALGIATSAYGRRGTGQINQLGYYDEFVSRTSPDIVVLVFVSNDFFENQEDRGPDQPWVTATRGKDGSFELRPPAAPQLKKGGSGVAGSVDKPALPVWDALRRFKYRVVNSSYFLGMLSSKIDFAAQDLPAAASGREALEYTAFALDQWRARARRDGFLLAVLATYTVGERGLFELERMASARDIPVVDQLAVVMRRNGRVQDLHFAHDGHWNATGHQRAAEALLEWLERNRDACARGEPPDPHE